MCIFGPHSAKYVNSFLRCVLLLLLSNMDLELRADVMFAIQNHSLREGEDFALSSQKRVYPGLLNKMCI